MEGIISLLSNMDVKVLYAIAVILLILGIVSLVKKVVSVAVTVLVISFLLAWAGPMVSELQDNYNFSVEDGVAIVTIKGDTFELSKDSVEDILIHEDEEGNKILSVLYNGEEKTFEIPGFVEGKIEDYADKLEIPIKIDK